MKVPLIRPTITEQMKKAVINTLDSLRFINGPQIKNFEQEFASYCNVKHAVTVSSGTAALHLSLIALKVEPGDEVITVSNSFIATASPVLLVRGKVKFVDIDPETYTMDPSKIEDIITKKTKVVIPVHLFGHPADLAPIVDIAKDHNLRIIEDACQAHGALYRAKKVGTFGDVACFSFFPSKNMTTAGDGGMIVTNNEELNDQLRLLRNHGRKSKYVHDILGFNYRLGEIQSAIGREQLKLLNDWINQRREHARIYSEELKDIVSVPIEKDWARHTYHLYVIRTKQRKELQEYLKRNEIETGVHYPVPIHVQPIFRDDSSSHVSLPVTERYKDEILSLPLFPGLQAEQRDFVITKIRDFFGK